MSPAAFEDDVSRHLKGFADQADHSRALDLRRSEQRRALHAEFRAQFRSALHLLHERGFQTLPVVTLSHGYGAGHHGVELIDKVHRTRVLPIGRLALYDDVVRPCSTTTSHRGSLLPRFLGGITKGQPVVEVQRHLAEESAFYPLVVDYAENLLVHTDGTEYTADRLPAYEWLTRTVAAMINAGPR